MANKHKKYRENVAGKYYVSQECIGCTLCSEIALDNFRINSEEGYDYVFRQPDNDYEDALCKEAIHSCPVNAIGNDG